MQLREHCIITCWPSISNGTFVERKYPQLLVLNSLGGTAIALSPSWTGNFGATFMKSARVNMLDCRDLEPTSSRLSPFAFFAEGCSMATTACGASSLPVAAADLSVLALFAGGG